jgi:Flp pilus assembly protein TadG
MLAHSLRPFRRTRPRRGAATVEFAVVVPILMTFVLGIIEIGRLVMVAQMSTNSSREAARYAVQGNCTADEVAAYTRRQLAQAGIPESAVRSVTLEYQTTSDGATTAGWMATADPKSLPAGTPVRATVAIDYDQVSWLPARFFVRGGTQVTGVTVARKE